MDYMLYKPKEEVEKIIDNLFVLLDGDNDGFVEYEELFRVCTNFY